MTSGARIPAQRPFSSPEVVSVLLQKERSFQAKEAVIKGQMGCGDRDLGLPPNSLFGSQMPLVWEQTNGVLAASSQADFLSPLFSSI